MLISILTLFPEMFGGPFSHSILKKAQEKEILKINLLNIRDFSTDKHRTVDDRPYGGGRGMILRVDVLDRTIQFALRNEYNEVSPRTRSHLVILLDPQGKTFNQKLAKRLSKLDHLILICGHYEGVDERVRKFVDEEISIGDYVLTGGEIPAMVLVDAVARLIPGVLKGREVTQRESFSNFLLEYPQYTRPPVYKPLGGRPKIKVALKKWEVPAILLSGNHAKIDKWQKLEAFKRTKKRRPDLNPTQRG